jgi:preprotein translocase subunit SecE
MAKSALAASDAKGMSNIGEQMKSWPQRVMAFYSDVRTEMKKVTTPSRKEVQATTVVVIITVFLFGAYFAVIDKVIGTGIDRLLRYFTHR